LIDTLPIEYRAISLQTVQITNLSPHNSPIPDDIKQIEDRNKSRDVEGLQSAHHFFDLIVQIKSWTYLPIIPQSPVILNKLKMESVAGMQRGFSPLTVFEEDA
jgi:hypothetical protein